MLSHVRLFATPQTVAHQGPLSRGFSRQEYWRGLPLPPPGDLPDPAVEPTSLVSPALASGFFFLNINLFTLIGGQLLYNIVVVLPYIDMDPHRCTCVPHPEPPLTSLPNPSLWAIPVHQPRASCIMHRTWTGSSFHIW